MARSRASSALRPLTKERVLRAAVDLADRHGLPALTMRRLGAELGVEAMSLYKHVANKDEILDGIVGSVLGEIEIPEGASDWKEAMRRRAVSARQVLRRHSWAIGLLEARGSTAPAALRYVDAILGNLRSAGFSLVDAAHAFWVLDAYVYGQVLQEISLPVPAGDEPDVSAAETSDEAATSAEYPNLAAVTQHARSTGSFSFDGEFAFGLDLILDALEAHRDRA